MTKMHAVTVVPLPTAEEVAASEDLRTKVRVLMGADKRLSQSRIAAESGLSSTTISQWLNGIYTGDNSAVETKLERWVDTTQAARERASAMPDAPGYIDTRTGGLIIAALRYAQLAGDIAVIYGGAGLGKTAAIRQFSLMAPNVWHATVTRASAGVAPSLEVIVDAIGINASGTAYRLHNAICKRVTNTIGLLVIDEAQHLTEAALDQIRAIHDATGIGVALVGNEQVYARMTGGSRAAYLDRLFSRIGKKVRLSKVTQEDANALLDGWKVSDGKTRALLMDVASKPGALRGMTKVLRLSSMYAAADGRKLNLEDVRQAWAELGGSN